MHINRMNAGRELAGGHGLSGQLHKLSNPIFCLGDVMVDEPLALQGTLIELTL